MIAQAYRPPTLSQAQTGAETRQCYNCGEYGHLGKDCRHPDRRKAAGAAARSLEETASQSGSARSLSTQLSASAQGGMRRLCTMRDMKRVDSEGWQSSTRATNLSDNLLYNSSPVYNSDSDMSYSNSSIPAGLISRFPIAQV